MINVPKNGTMVTHDLPQNADVLVDDGRIAQIGRDLKSDEALDATRRIVMRSGTDT